MYVCMYVPTQILCPETSARPLSLSLPSLFHSTHIHITHTCIGLVTLVLAQQELAVWSTHEQQRGSVWRAGTVQYGMYVCMYVCTCICVCIYSTYSAANPEWQFVNDMPAGDERPVATPHRLQRGAHMPVCLLE